MKPVYLKTYVARRAGRRGLVITLPETFIKLNNIEQGTAINVYLVDGQSNVLILEGTKDNGQG